MSKKITLPHHHIVERWKEHHVIKWLKKVDLEDCIIPFEKRHIDGPKLLELTEQKLFTYQDLKIKHRRPYDYFGRTHAYAELVNSIKQEALRMYMAPISPPTNTSS